MPEPITTTVTSALWFYIKVVIVFIVPFVEPQIAGMLGALAYLIVRHELGMSTMKFSSLLVVAFFGWMGAWATVNVLSECDNISHAWTQISSATIGFLSYDAMLLFGKNSSSVLGFLTSLIKKSIEKVVEKWNS